MSKLFLDMEEWSVGTPVTPELAPLTPLLRRAGELFSKALREAHMYSPALTREIARPDERVVELQVRLTVRDRPLLLTRRWDAEVLQADPARALAEMATLRAEAADFDVRRQERSYGA